MKDARSKVKAAAEKAQLKDAEPKAEEKPKGFRRVAIEEDSESEEETAKEDPAKSDSAASKPLV